ncbi:hypothetical protein VTN00DRAFT_3593 [Thermoascus crustaceus]|uniref:uncharacterized protein n=1 Tax=Thermoascus crustaceus TaxID=5088 RepID=UPI0037422832
MKGDSSTAPWDGRESSSVMRGMQEDEDEAGGGWRRTRRRGKGGGGEVGQGCELSRALPAVMAADALCPAAPATEFSTQCTVLAMLTVLFAVLRLQDLPPYHPLSTCSSSHLADHG